MSAKVIIFLRPSNTCPPDCECQKRNPQKLASLAKHLAKHVKERELEDTSKVPVVRGSAIFLHPPKY